MGPDVGVAFVLTGRLLLLLISCYSWFQLEGCRVHVLVVTCVLLIAVDDRD